MEAVAGEAESEKEALQKRYYKGACLVAFSAVFSHVINIQTETIMFRNAARGDLAKATKALSFSVALANFLGIVVNQFGGKLSDSLGRRIFFSLGPIAQALSGIISFSMPNSLMALCISKIQRLIFTTFSGTVMAGAGMRDMFAGRELAVKGSKLGAIIGLGIVTGPIVEGALLKRLGPGQERYTYLALIANGVAMMFASQTLVPETLSKEKRTEFNASEALRGANPFSFVQIYTKGSAALQKMVTISSLQTMIDGKAMSDLGQIWMREHLKMSMEGIRNFVVSYGMACSIAGMSLSPALLKNLSTEAYTQFTNLTNFIGFSVRGCMESVLCYTAAVPMMLPGVNGSSNAALAPIISEQLQAAGFGIGESTAWMSNMRSVAATFASLLYGSVYAWLLKKKMNAGHTYFVAGFFGAAIPQLLYMSLLASDPDYKKTKKLADAK